MVLVLLPWRWCCWYGAGAAAMVYGRVKCGILEAQSSVCREGLEAVWGSCRLSPTPLPPHMLPPPPFPARHHHHLHPHVSLALLPVHCPQGGDGVCSNCTCTAYNSTI
ncbi:hypothetical protein Vafri_19854 [Volvox africanus]|uniref:Secreted protein n=1 Tax=Volvox africanus TaxID=51714 RepID=A0A8J4BQ53_9CHLO|nr:hypothetical protein Vafri_19854 [Volvox africanus]